MHICEYVNSIGILFQRRFESSVKFAGFGEDFNLLTLCYGVHSDSIIHRALKNVSAQMALFVLTGFTYAFSGDVMNESLWQSAFWPLAVSGITARAPWQPEMLGKAQGSGAFI